MSESLLALVGATSNFILDNFIYYPFGVSGSNYSDLSAYPYVFDGNSESILLKCTIEKIIVTNEVSGISGQTEFRIERQLAAGGAWTNIFSTNCIISNTAADNISFQTGVAAPSGVTLPVVSITDLDVNDRMRWVLISAATNANNLQIKVITRPIN